jgi:hypothetical protein
MKISSILKKKPIRKKKPVAKKKVVRKKAAKKKAAPKKKPVAKKKVGAVVNKNKIISNYRIGDIISFKDGEDWKVVKVKDKIGILVIKPYNEKAKKNNVSIEIDIDADYLRKNIKSVNNYAKNKVGSLPKIPQYVTQYTMTVASIANAQKTLDEINYRIKLRPHPQMKLQMKDSQTKLKKYIREQKTHARELKKLL